MYNPTVKLPHKKFLSLSYLISPPVDDGDTPVLEAVVEQASNSIFNAVERAVSNIHELVPGDAIVDEDTCTYHDGVEEATSGIYLAVERGVGKLHGLVASLRGEPAHLATSKLHQVRTCASTSIMLLFCIVVVMFLCFGHTESK